MKNFFRYLYKEKNHVIIEILIVIFLSIHIPIIVNKFETNIPYSVNKRFGDIHDLREFITPLTISETNGMDPLEIMNWIVKNYKYVEDGTGILNINDGDENSQTLTNQGDLWLFPGETLAIRENCEKYNIKFTADCEDLAALLVSIGIGNGYSMKEVVGDVNVPGYGTYGHAWAEWKQNNKIYFLDPIAGPQKELGTVPKECTPFYKFDNKSVIQVVVGGSSNQSLSMPTEVADAWIKYVKLN